MTEALDPKPEQPIRVEIGKAFRPFEHLRELPRLVTAHRNFDASFDSLVSRGVELNGIKATLVLIVVSAHRSTPNFETPLGKATRQITTIYENGQKTETETKTPLSIVLFSRLNLQGFETLKPFDLELKMGEETYRLDCPEDTIVKELDPNWPRHNDKQYNCVSDKPVKSDGQKVNIFLPWDPSKLSTIEARLVKKSPSK